MRRGRRGWVLVGGGVGGKSLGCLPMEVDFASGEPQTILEQGPDLVVFISLVCSGGWTDGGEAPEGEARGWGERGQRPGLVEAGEGDGG